MTWPPLVKDRLGILRELPKFLSSASDSESASVGKPGLFGYSLQPSQPRYMVGVGFVATGQMSKHIHGQGSEVTLQDLRAGKWQSESPKPS